MRPTGIHCHRAVDPGALLCYHQIQTDSMHGWGNLNGVGGSFFETDANNRFGFFLNHPTLTIGSGEGASTRVGSPYHHQVRDNAMHPWRDSATGWRFISTDTGDPAAGIYMNSPTYSIGLYDHGGSCAGTLIL